MGTHLPWLVVVLQHNESMCLKKIKSRNAPRRKSIPYRFWLLHNRISRAPHVNEILLTLTSERVNEVLKATEHCQLSQEFEQAYLQISDGSVRRAIIRVVVKCRRILTKRGSA